MKLLFSFVVFFLMGVLPAVCEDSVIDGLVSVGYVNQVRTQLDGTMVKTTGDQEISGAKTFSGTLTASGTLAADDSSNKVATTSWTNAAITSAKGYVPSGSADSDTFVKTWVDNSASN